MPQRILIRADLQCAGMVLISENYFPGWTATVDGKPAKIYEAYGAVRGVAVGPGSHRIEMAYRPMSVYLGALMTVSGLLIAAALAVRERRRCSKA